MDILTNKDSKLIKLAKHHRLNYLNRFVYNVYTEHDKICSAKRQQQQQYLQSLSDFRVKIQGFAINSLNPFLGGITDENTQ